MNSQERYTEPVFKFYDSAKQVDEQNGIVRFTHTTMGLDRDKEVVVPNGALTENIRKDPVFLWSHDRRIPAIGRIIFEEMKMTQQAIRSPVFFHYEKDPFADLIFQKYVDDILHAVSISFIPIEVDSPILDEQTGATFRVWEWLETSSVNIPSNPGALEDEYRTAKDKSYKDFAAPYYEGIMQYYQLQTGDNKTEKIYCYMGKCYLMNWKKAFDNTDTEQESAIEKAVTEKTNCEKSADTKPVKDDKESDKVEQLRDDQKEKNPETAETETPDIGDSPEKSILPALVDEIKGSYEWAIKHLEANAKEFSVEHNSIVGFREGSDRIAMVATFEDRGIFVIIGMDRPFSDDPVFRARWELKDGMPQWKGRPQKVKLSVSVRRRAYEALKIEKDFADENKAVVSYSGTPTLSESRSWDGAAAARRMRNWASSDGSGDADKMNWPKYRRGFTWYDRENEETFGAYKLPHHDIDNGELKTHWRGTSAAMAALLGARGGVDVPDGDRRGIYNHLSRHYRQYDRTPPEFRQFKRYSEVAAAMIELQDKNFDMIEEDRKALYEFLCEKYAEFDKEPPEFVASKEHEAQPEAPSNGDLNEEDEQRLTERVFDILEQSLKQSGVLN